MQQVKRKGVRVAPLERQVEEDEENARSVSTLVRSPAEASNHGSETGCRDKTPTETGEEHLAARIDLVVKPGAAGVVEEPLGKY